MGYKKKWVPPVKPLRNDLGVWKVLFNDLHQNLLDAGLSQTSTEDQLVIGDVAAYPGSGTFAGFIEYDLMDALHAVAPVRLRLYFGCGVEGLGGNNSRSMTPRIKCEVYFKGTKLAEFQTPQAFNAGSPSVTTAASDYGFSVICKSDADGFFGITYGAGSRNKPFAYNNSGDYYGATFTLFLQRPLNDAGILKDDALAIYHPNLNVNIQTGLWNGGVLPLSVSVFAGLGVTARTDMAPRIGRSGISSSGERVLIEPINFPGIPAQPFPFIVSYRDTDITTGAEFMFSPMNGPERNFIALGNETCISVDGVDGQRAGVAMLYE